MPQKEIAVTKLEEEDQMQTIENAESLEGQMQESFVCPEGKILVVDDSDMNLILIKSLLKRTLLQVDVATDGEECLERIKDKKYDLILMDYMMPNMDGVDTLKHIKQNKNHKCVDTPIVVLTANAVSGVKDALLKEGFLGYLSKPISGDELERQLIRFLPEDKITYCSKERNDSVFTEKKLAEYKVLLEEYDISLQDGLRYTSGDVMQYAYAIDFFVKNSPKNRINIEECMVKQDIRNLRILMHALKSNAKSIGAEELYYCARKAEMKCLKADSTYLELNQKLLFLEWDRAIAGIQKFLSESNVLEQLKERNKVAESIKPKRVKDILNQLEACLQQYEAEPALKLLNKLEKIPFPPVMLESLHKITELIDDIEMEEAREELRKVRGRFGYE